METIISHLLLVWQWLVELNHVKLKVYIYTYIPLLLIIIILLYLGEITNFPEEYEKRFISVEKLPHRLFPMKKTYFVNDLEGLCLGIVEISRQKQLNEYFTTLWDNSQKKKNDNKKWSELSFAKHGVLAMGTGLGVALIVPNPSTENEQKLEVIAAEFGHTKVFPAGKKDENYLEDRKLIDFIEEKL